MSDQSQPERPGAEMVVFDVVENQPVLGFQVEAFNWRLRRARQARGWTRAELARQIGVTPGIVGDAAAVPLLNWIAPAES